VVIAASKMLHEAPLGDRDRASLIWAKEMLARVLAAEAVVVVPSADELVAGDETLTLLWRATSQLNEEMRTALGAVSEATQRALAGQYDPHAIDAARMLRELFTTVSNVALRRQVDAHAGDPKSGPWQRSTVSSNS
jgi:hypothetical protein